MQITKTKFGIKILAGLFFFGCAVFVFANINEGLNKNILNDSDQDGLSDQEEVVLGTDSKNSDTDGDGYSDGAEIESGFNPLIKSPDDRVVGIELKNKLQNASVGQLEDLSAQFNENLEKLITENQDQELNSAKLDDLVQSQVAASAAQIDQLVESEIIDEADLQALTVDLNGLNSERKKAEIERISFEYGQKIFYALEASVSGVEARQAGLNGTEKYFQNIRSILSSPVAGSALKLKEELKELDGFASALKTMEVPSIYLSEHVRLYALTSSLVKLGGLKINPEDYVAQIYLISKIGSAIEEFGVIGSAYEDKFKSFK